MACVALRSVQIAHHGPSAPSTRPVVLVVAQFDPSSCANGAVFALDGAAYAPRGERVALVGTLGGDAVGILGAVGQACSTVLDEHRVQALGSVDDAQEVGAGKVAPVP